MLANIQNENYGYSVTTHDDWVVVGNPSSFRYNSNSSSFWRTGSFDIFRYNTLTDKHDLMLSVFKPIGSIDNVVLADDTGSREIHTDIFTSIWSPVYKTISDIAIQLDGRGYTSTYEDDYGHSVDVYNNMLAVGCRWYNQRFDIGTRAFYLTGSSVDIYNLTALKSTAFDGYISTGSGFLATIVPPPAGESISSSFGTSISINDEWLAVGSPNWNNTIGGVHVYRRNSPGNPDNLNFSFFTTITGSTSIVGDQFGYSLDLNKATGSYSSSLVVGCGNKTFAGSKVYYFEFSGSYWREQFKFSADRTLYPLPFYDVDPIPRCDDYTIDGFGNSVALFKNDIAVGAPTDRWIYEFSGSRAYKQGAAYLFNKCSEPSRGWRLVEKFYGNDKTLKNNKMGFSVDLWDDKCIVGCPKSSVESLSSCYIEGSIFQENYCYANLENYIHGQWVLFQKNTSSVDVQWDTLNVYQKKKRFLSPFRSFGYDVCVGNKSIVIGSPMIIADNNRSLNLISTGSIIGTNIIPLDDLSGKAYIYNNSNFRNEFHVGNVFYRNGKIILNTSGSVFEGIWFNPVNEYNYEYEVHFNSKQTLYEKQITCVVEPGEFNVSTNPSAVVREQAAFDINGNGKFDWQDLDIILSYMQMINTKYSPLGVSTDWSSSLLTTNEEISFYNFNSTNNYYKTKSDFLTQSFYKILDDIDPEYFDFNQDSKIDLNDMNIFWKYSNNRLNQLNYQSYITPNSKRKLFSDILDHLNTSTGKSSPPLIKPEFLTYDSQSLSDKTGSYLAPYVTTIGLYSGLDLIAVAKLGNPIKLTKDFPINFVVKIDF